MCGIIGYVGADPCAQLLLDGLSKLEYRGYDSAGIAVVSDETLHTRRAEGKLRNLVNTLENDPVDGTPGIGHTRWATHGGPTEENAHPHRVGTVAVVHNGIIENHLEIKRELADAGHSFSSETDTEIIAHLVWQQRETGLGLEDAVRAAVLRLEGAYSIVVVDATEPERLVAARLSSPLVLGLGEGANYVASDIPAILAHTRRMVFLDDGVMAVVEADEVRVTEIESGAPVEVKARQITWSPAMAEKGGYKHFMLKEIHEQPDAVANTLRGRISQERTAVDLPELVARRARRALSARRPRPARAPRRARQRAPLPQSAHERAHLGPGHQPVRGDRRHVGGAQRRQGPGGAHLERVQRHRGLDPSPV
jgi:glucosamine--fructose-6-phosphate aminotransferase (isomerizing)